MAPFGPAVALTPPRRPNRPEALDDPSPATLDVPHPADRCLPARRRRTARLSDRRLEALAVACRPCRVSPLCGRGAMVDRGTVRAVRRLTGSIVSRVTERNDPCLRPGRPPPRDSASDLGFPPAQEGRAARRGPAQAVGRRTGPTRASVQAVRHDGFPLLALDSRLRGKDAVPVNRLQPAANAASGGWRSSQGRGSTGRRTGAGRQRDDSSRGRHGPARSRRCTAGTTRHPELLRRTRRPTAAGRPPAAAAAQPDGRPAGRPRGSAPGASACSAAIRGEGDIGTAGQRTFSRTASASAGSVRPAWPSLTLAKRTLASRSITNVAG